MLFWTFTGVFLTLSAGKLAGVHGAGDHEWTYGTGDHGPSQWHHHYPHCGDDHHGHHDHQSPLNVIRSDVKVNTSLTPIVFSGYSNPIPASIKNNGHAVTVGVSGEAMMSGGGLPSQYKLAQFHFHWGTENGVGSEHLLDGKQYPMEMHLVHYDSQTYQDIATAVDKHDGLAVLGVFIEVGSETNVAFQKIVDELPKIKYMTTGDPIDIGQFAVNSLLPTSRQNYYRYRGSLTTPPCYESVVWTLLESTISISQAQMDAFRSNLLQGATDTSGQIENNYRPVQHMHGRVVQCSSADMLNDGMRLSYHWGAVIILLLVSLLGKIA